MRPKEDRSEISVGLLKCKIDKTIFFITPKVVNDGQHCQ